MRIVSEAKYKEEIERRMSIRDEHRWYCDRFENFEKKLYELEMKVDKLTEIAHEPRVEGECVKADIVMPPNGKGLF